MSSQPYVQIGHRGLDVKERKALVRSEVRPAWNALVALVKQKYPGVDLDRRIIQARGFSDTSAGTHSDGAAIDVRVWGLTGAQRREIVRLAREVGFPASWDRAWSGNEHLHLGADIPDKETRVSYQVVAVKAGRNGLGYRGWRGPDDGPKPSEWRNTTTGPLWAATQLKSEIERLLDDMDEKQLRKIIREEAQAAARAVVGRVPHVDPMSGRVDSTKTHAINTSLRQIEQQVARIKATVYALRAKK